MIGSLVVGMIDAGVKSGGRDVDRCQRMDHFAGVMTENCGFDNDKNGQIGCVQSGHIDNIQMILYTAMSLIG